MAFLGLYLYNWASYGRFTDFWILQHGFLIVNFLRYFVCWILGCEFWRYFLLEFKERIYNHQNNIFFANGKARIWF